jgi:cytochrome b
MNDMSASRAEAPTPAASRTVLVWDAPVRVFHWLMVASFGVAWLSAESERWRLLHITAGYTMVGLVAFRVVWGLVGTRHARFANFVRGPRAALDHLAALLGRTPATTHPAGHNPAGGLAIVAMLLLTLAVAGTGWATLNEVGAGWLGDAHEAVAEAMLLLVGVHVTAVFIASWLQRENLVGAMIDGRKAVPPQEGVRSAWRSVAVLLLAAVIAGWWWQWQAAPAGLPLAGNVSAHEGDRDSDDD